ncbi:hypothetical protein ACWC2K_06815 [Streptomyces chattanoogensis]|uniref:hypothetical protein n=1 Tax=Streptomyces chattanoogensis TaxID=66876 RepID=UPI0036A9E3E1
MSFPPPPPPSNQPPSDNPGGYGPPAGGGFGQGGYGYPQAGNQPPGGYGPPAGGGYGPGGPVGPGGWQQPVGPPPGGGGGNGKVIAAIIGGGALVVAAVITLVVLNNDDEPKHRAQPAGSSASATPSESASPTPSDDPTSTPSDTASPTSSSGDLPFYQLKVGDCYDRTARGAGYNQSASCNGPHDAEVVSVHRLVSGLKTEDDIKQQAASLCKKELARKAAQQPAGTAEGTYVQFPNFRGYDLGIKSVSCSLTGNSSITKKLTKPLS